MNRSAGRLLLWVVSSLLAACAAQEGGGTAAPSATQRPNVLLIVVDTLRADHLDAYGYARETAPAITDLARRGVRFDQHRAQAPCTFPSVNSLLTSQPVDRFFGRPEGELGIPEEVATVAGLLRAEGYVTAAFSASPIVRRSPSHFNPSGGFAGGFALFDEACLWKDAGCVNRRIFETLPQHRSGEPLFLYVHYIDPHGPYKPPRKTRRSFARPGEGRRFSEDVRGGVSHLAAAQIDQGLPPGVGAAEIAYWIDLYDDEIAWVDRAIGELVEGFERAAPPYGTVVFFASDHGESFLEHGTLAHCRSLYDTEIRTPFVVAGPGVPAGQVRTFPTTNLDLVPTLLDLAGVSFSPSAFAGRSLRPAMISDGPMPVRLQTSAFAGWRSASDGRYKLLVQEGAGIVRLFDLVHDAGETIDLADRERKTAFALRKALAQATAEALARGENGSGSDDAGADAEHQLRALGYL